MLRGPVLFVCIFKIIIIFIHLDAGSPNQERSLILLIILQMLKRCPTQRFDSLDMSYFTTPWYEGLYWPSPFLRGAFYTFSSLVKSRAHTKGEIKLLGTQSQSRFADNGHRSCWLKCLPRTCPGFTRGQKNWVTLCLSLCGQVHRRKIKGSKTWLSLTYTGEKVKMTQTIFQISMKRFIYGLHIQS